MSTLADKRKQVVGVVREMKESRVQDCGPGDDPWDGDAMPVIQGWRGDEPVVVMVTMNQGPDEALNAVRIAALGFGCDTIALSNDTWGASGPINPVTGRDWEEGDMEKVAKEHDGIAKGWIKESMTTMVVNRAGDMMGAVHPYDIDRTAKPWTVTFGKTQWLDEGAEGLMPEAMTRLMNEPSIMQEMAQAGVTGEMFGLSPVETQAHADCAIVKTMGQLGFSGAVLLIADDPDRQRIINESVGHMKMDKDDEGNFVVPEPPAPNKHNLY